MPHEPCSPLWKERKAPFWGFPGGSVVKICLPMQETGFDPWVGKIPWRWKQQPTPDSCLGNPMDRRAWCTTVRGSQMSQTQLRDQTRTLRCSILGKHTHFLFHSIILFHLCPEDCTPFSPLDFPGSPDGKASAHNAGDLGSIPGSVTFWQKWASCTISPLSDSLWLILFPGFL